MADKFRPEILADGYAAAAQNCFLDEEKITKRNGYALVANDLGSKPCLGLGALETGAGSKTIFSVFDDATSTNSDIYYWEGSGNWATITGATDLTAGKIGNFVQANNNTYYFNQTDTVRKIAGTTATSIAAIPLGLYGVWFHNFLFVSGVTANPSRLYWSDVGAPDTHSGGVSGNVDINPDDGEPITGLSSLKDELIIFKRSRVWSLTGFGTTTFTLADITERLTGIGTLSHKSIINTGNDLLFISFLGQIPHIKALSRTRFGTLVDGGIISDPIATTMNGLNKGALDKVAAIFDGRKAWIAVPNGASTFNNLVLVYDTVDKSWTKHTGINASNWLSFGIGSTIEIYFGEGNTDSKVYKLGTTKDDNSATIAFQYTTKKIRPSPEKENTWIYLYVTADATGNYDVTVEYSLDGFTFTTLGTLNLLGIGATWGTGVWGTMKWGSTDTVRERFAFPSITSQDIQLRFTNTTDDADISITEYELFFKTKGLRDV